MCWHYYTEILIIIVHIVSLICVVLYVNIRHALSNLCFGLLVKYWNVILPVQELGKTQEMFIEFAFCNSSIFES